jgi:KUP system potassium uptake protein
MKPRLNLQERYDLQQINNNCYQLLIFYGFLEKPNIPEVFDLIKIENPFFDSEKVTFFIGRENIFATNTPGMAIWREKIFALMSKNEMPATQYFELPKHRVIEIGAQFAL